MMGKEKEKIASVISTFLQKREEISFAYIFGSFAEKTPIAFRDIDIGVFVEPRAIEKNKAFDYESGLAIQLARLLAFPADRVDVKVLNLTSPIFQNHVFSRGTLLFAKNPGLLDNLIEETSQEAVANHEFSKQSLVELLR